MRGSAQLYAMSPTPDGQQIGSHAGITFTVAERICIGPGFQPLVAPSLRPSRLERQCRNQIDLTGRSLWPLWRKSANESLFAEPGTFVILAERDGDRVGYALCHLLEGPDDTWDTGDSLGEIETLVLGPDVRGNGVGSALMDAAEAELGRRGARDIMTAVMEGNNRIRDFYLRRGMQPTVTYLMRLAPQEGGEPSPARTNDDRSTDLVVEHLVAITVIDNRGNDHREQHASSHDV